MQKTIKFTAKLEQWKGDKANWHYVYLPKDDSAEISEIFALSKRGFGSLKVEVELGKTVWKTSIFPDSEGGKYILFIKAEVRKAENVKLGDKLKLAVTVLG